MAAEENHGRDAHEQEKAPSEPLHQTQRQKGHLKKGDTKDATDAAKPATDAAKPATDAAKPATDAAKPTQSPREQELIEMLQRLQAEFENYRKRVDREREEFRKHAVDGAIASLLPVVDNFRIALQAHENRDDEFFKGIEIIFAQLLGILKDHGVEPISAEGERFNPALHEALLTEARAELEPNTILEVLQEGYTLHGKVLRPARVKVSKAP